ncbi:hypothetical protein D3C85_1066630 [compost metagenome]
MAQFDFRIILGHLFDHFTPQLAGGQYVGLVHRAQLLATDHGHVETDTGDTTDFAFAVRQGVIGLTLAVFQGTGTTRRAEVDAAGQLANDQDVQAGHDFRLQAGSLGQLRVQDRRTQVAEQAQLRTDFQQAALRADVTFDGIPFRAANGAQQHGVGRAGTLQGLVGQRHAVLVDGSATDHIKAQLETQGELVAGQFQHLDRFGHDFRANTVTWENQNLLAHAFLMSSVGAPWAHPEKFYRSAISTSTSVLNEPSASISKYSRTSLPIDCCNSRIAARITCGVRMRSTQLLYSRRKR